MAEIMEWEESQFALWVIRHCDREDVNNPSWFATASSNPHSLARDNTPISRQGRKQGEQLRERFSNIKLDHIFASPFERTIETASLIAAKQPLSTIKVEPGLVENCFRPPGFEEAGKLANRFPLVDLNYKPAFAHPWGDLDKSAHPFVDATQLEQRVKSTVEHIVLNYGRRQGQIAIVTHAPVVYTIQKLVIGQATFDKFVDVSSVSKFVHKKYQSSSDAIVKKFSTEMFADLSHLKKS